MDDKIRRAEELLEQRSRERGANGHTNVETEAQGEGPLMGQGPQGEGPRRTPGCA